MIRALLAACPDPPPAGAAVAVAPRGPEPAHTHAHDHQHVRPGRSGTRRAAPASRSSKSRLDEETLRRTARELAYADRSPDALALLARSTAPGASEVLTLTAFAHGRAGELDTALPIYGAALTADSRQPAGARLHGSCADRRGAGGGRRDASCPRSARVAAPAGWPDRGSLRAGIAAGGAHRLLSGAGRGAMPVEFALFRGPRSNPSSHLAPHDGTRNMRGRLWVRRWD